MICDHRVCVCVFVLECDKCVTCGRRWEERAINGNWNSPCPLVCIVILGASKFKPFPIHCNQHEACLRTSAAQMSTVYAVMFSLAIASFEVKYSESTRFTLSSGSSRVRRSNRLF